MLAAINKRYDVETNILFANISEIQDTILGIIIVQVIGSPAEINKAQSYLKSQKVGYQEVGLGETDVQRRSPVVSGEYAADIVPA